MKVGSGGGKAREQAYSLLGHIVAGVDRPDSLGVGDGQRGDLLDGRACPNLSDAARRSRSATGHDSCLSAGRTGGIATSAVIDDKVHNRAEILPLFDGGQRSPCAKLATADRCTGGLRRSSTPRLRGR